MPVQEAFDQATGITFTVNIPEGSSEAEIRQIVDRQTQRARRAAGVTPFNALAGEPGGPPAGTRSPQAPVTLGSSLLPRRPEDFRGAAVLAGETLGGLAGVPGGPATTAAGLALGAAGGSLAFDVGVDAARRVGLLEQPDPRARFERPGVLRRGVGAEGFPVTRAGEEALFSLALPALSSAGRQAGRGALRRLAGVPAGGNRLRLAAEEQGIGLGIEDVTERGGIRGFRRIVGIFPFANKPLKEAKERQGKQFARRFDRILDDLGPPIADPDLGTQAIKVAKKRFGALMRPLQEGYDAVFDEARRRGAVLQTRPIREAAEEITRLADESTPRILVQQGDELVEKPMPRVVQNKVRALSKSLEKLTDEMTLQQWKGLQNEIVDLVEVSKNKGLPFREATQLKQAMKLARSTMDQPDLVRELDQLDREFGAVMRVFETPTAKRFLRVDRRAFRAGVEELGTVEADRLMQVAFRADSPIAMRDLRRIVGPTTFKRAVRNHIETAVELAVERQKKGDLVFNLKSFRQLLGLQKRRTASSERLALREALKGTNVSVRDLDQFLDVLETASQQGIIDVSQFVARRAGISGARGAIRAVLPGAAATSALNPGAQSSVLSTASVALMTVFATRKTGRLFTDPATLKAATTLLDPKIPIATRRAAAGRFMRLLGTEALRNLNEPEPQDPNLTGLQNVGRPQAASGVQ